MSQPRLALTCQNPVADVIKAFLQRLATATGWCIHRFATVVRQSQCEPLSGGALRIAVLCDAFVRYGSAQAVGLAEAGASVTVYHIDRLGEFDGNEAEKALHLERLARSGIDAVELPHRDVKRTLRHARDLRRDLRQRRIDVLLIQQHIDPRYALTALGFRAVLIVHDPQTHSGDYRSTYPAPVRALARFAEVTASAVMIHSSRLERQIRPLLRSLPVCVAPHGTDVASRSAVVEAPPLLALVGRLMAYKGVDVAIEAFRNVRQARPDCRLLLAGRGNLGDAIRQSRGDGVQLIDRYISETELDAIIGGARLVLLPYRDATQSGVGLRALGKGVPCIVSDAGALPDLVPPGREWVVPAGDANALTTAILSALDHDSETRDSVLAFAKERFSWLVAAETLLRELNRLGLANHLEI